MRSHPITKKSNNAELKDIYYSQPPVQRTIILHGLNYAKREFTL